MTAPSGDELARLAALHGVATSYQPSPDRTVTASAAAVTRALAALGVDAGSPEAVRAALAARERELAGRLLPPTVVCWQGSPCEPLATLPEGAVLRVRTEQGESRDSVEGLPPGVHGLTVTAPDGRTGHAHLVVAPPRLPTPAGRSYGLLVQLYSLLSRRSWGMGDLGDLGELTAWAGRALGAGFVQVNPLHAAVPGAPTDPPRTGPPRAVSPTRCICGSRTSPSSRTSGTTLCGPRCSKAPGDCAKPSWRRAS